MVSIQINLYGRLGTNLGTNIKLDFLENTSPTIRHVITKLIEMDPILKDILLKNDKLSQGTILLINGHIMNRSELGLDTPLKEEDHITVDKLGFIEIVGGGSEEKKYNYN